MKKEIIKSSVIIVFLIALVGTANAIPFSNIVYSSDFEGTVDFTNWSDASLSTDTTLGQYHGNYTRAENTTLIITGLGLHTELALDFDLYLFRSWDGNNRTYGKDYFSLAGDISQSWTFTNHQPQGQTYNGSPDEILGSGARATHVYRDLGLTGLDSGFVIPHTAETFTITFGGPTSQTDEWWGIDNVMVSTNGISENNFSPAPVPEPATMFLFGTGLVGLAGARLRRRVTFHNHKRNIVQGLSGTVGVIISRVNR